MLTVATLNNMYFLLSDMYMIYNPSMDYFGRFISKSIHSFYLVVWLFTRKTQIILFVKDYIYISAFYSLIDTFLTTRKVLIRGCFIQIILPDIDILGNAPLLIILTQNVPL